MGTPAVIDVDRLLQPIPGDSPTGVELNSMSPKFDALKSAFTQAKVAERKLRDELLAAGEDGAVTVEPPQWRPVVDGAIELLQNETKDLRIAAWLIEGLLRQHGFAGVRDGLRVFRGLCEQYWDGVHPRPTAEEGHREAMAQFNGFAGESSLVPFNELPITRSSTGEAYTSIDYAEASELEGIADADVREKRIAAGSITFSQLEDAVRKTDRPFYVDLVDDLQQILDQFAAIGDVADPRCQADEYGESTAPSVVVLRGRVRDLLDNLKQMAASHLEQPEENAVGEAVNGELITTPGGVSRSRMSAGAVANREDALEVLRKVADFFEHTEPHSPLSFALRQIVGWGKMSLPELLRELIEDDNVMRSLEKRIGIPRSEESY